MKFFEKNKYQISKKCQNIFQVKFEKKHLFYFGIFEKINPKNPQKTFQDQKNVEKVKTYF